MSGPRRWTPLESELVHDCGIFTVSRVAARSPSTGRQHTFHTIACTDWVNIVPVTTAGEVVMVQQYRHGSQAVTLEIPGGMVDVGEDAATAAARELLEETGYRAARVVPIGAANPNPAIFGNRVYSFLGLDAEPVAEIRNEGAEETRVALVPESELRRRVLEGEIDHALVLAALHFHHLRREAGT